MITTRFKQGPKIQVTVFWQQNFCKVHLIPFETFSALFSPELPQSLQKILSLWLIQYSEKKPFPIFSSLPRQILPLFSTKVLQAMEAIPFGNVLSYGDIATQAGSPKAARAVGTICRLNPWPLFIPCHRVVPQGGKIGHYAFGSNIKMELLAFEGYS